MDREKRAYLAGLGAAAVALGSAVYTASAVSSLVPPPPGVGPMLPTPLTGILGLGYFVCGLIPWIFWGLIVLAIIMFLVGGYRYVTSAGDAEKIHSANKTLLYAAIAIVVALVAAGIPYLVDSFVTGGQSFVSGPVC